MWIVLINLRDTIALRAFELIEQTGDWQVRKHAHVPCINTDNPEFLH